MNQLTGRKAIITGAAQGMGRGIALELAKRGADVSLWDVKYEPLLDLAKEIELLGRTAIAFKVDVTNKSQVDRAIAETLNLLGGVDTLVNAAGVYSSILFKDMTEKDWDYVNQINAKGVFLCCKVVQPIMTKQRGGRIINIASAAGKTGAASEAHYVASKHAVIGLTKVLAIEFAKDNIRVNSICPGYIQTPMIEQIIKELAVMENKTEDQVVKDILATIPVGRMGTPEDVAKVVAFLASEDSEYVNGQSIGVCGGLEMH
jgi:meso-butanediol dehydrogenase/(S,S)-butanediol dehydrogenase/diacetyl reductase